MENMINIAEILKDCPRGMALDCTICDNVYFDKVELNSICCFIKNDNDNTYENIYFHHDGTYIMAQNAKCVIFPKGKTTWEGFNRPVKDGDVVVCVDYNDHANEERIIQVFIVKSATERNKNAYCYEGYDFEDKSLYCEGIWGFDRLATDAEKEMLFNDLQSDGYKWNDKTKKIEKLFIPKFKVGDTIAHKDNKKHPFTITEITNTSYRGGTRYEILIEQQDYFELVTDKFDINALKPFDKVLVRTKGYRDTWICAFFSYKTDYEYSPYWTTADKCYQQCIPYEGNEHLLGTTDDCDEFYKTW